MRGLKQDCALSLYLFYVLITDIEKEMKKGKWGGKSIFWFTWIILGMGKSGIFPARWH